MHNRMPSAAALIQPAPIPTQIVTAETVSGRPSLALRAVAATRREQLARALADGCRQLGGPAPSDCEWRVLAWLLDAPTPPSVWKVAAARAAISEAALAVRTSSDRAGFAAEGPAVRDDLAG